MATSNNRSTCLIALNTHPNKRIDKEFQDFTSLSFHMVCFILNKLVQSNTSTDTDQQSDTSLVFDMKENRWVKPTQAASSSEMDDK